MDKKFKFSFKSLIILIMLIFLGLLIFPELYDYVVKFDERRQEIIYINNYQDIDGENYDELKALTETMLENYPNNVAALVYKGYLEISTGNTEKGILVNERILELDSKHASAYNNLSWAYTRKGLYKLALFYGEKALRFNTDGNKFYEYTNVGDAYQGLKEYEKAIDNYKNAVNSYRSYYQPKFYQKYNEDLAYALQGQGECYLALNMKKEALSIFDDCFTLFPGNYSTFNSLFNIYKDAYNFRLLDEIVDKYIQNCEDQEKSYAYSRLAYVYFERDKHAEAARYYLLAAESAEYKGYYYYQAALSYAGGGDNESAGTYLAKAIEEDEYYKSEAETEPLLEELYE